MLYIAYMGTKKQNRIECCYWEKQKVPTKKRNYIYTYIVKKRRGCKVGHKRTQKKRD